MADDNSSRDEQARIIACLELRREQLRIEQAAQLAHLAALDEEHNMLEDLNIELQEAEYDLEREIERVEARNEELRIEIAFLISILRERMFGDNPSSSP